MMAKVKDLQSQRPKKLFLFFIGWSPSTIELE